MTPEILCFGEALWDLFPDGPVLGGAPLNLAYRLDSLGRKAAVVSCLGTDNLGLRARNLLRDYGMDDRFLFETGLHPTGTVRVDFDSNGEPSYLIVPDAAYDVIPLTDGLMEAAESAECLCFGTLAQRSRVSRTTLRKLLERRGDRLNLLDINLRPGCYDEEIVSYSMEKASILKLNEEEARELKILHGFTETDYRELAAAFCRRFGLVLCVLTMGSRGACAAGPGGPVCQEPSYEVPRIDPCGAGDAFTAAFLDSWLKGVPVDAACRRGNALGSAVTARRGALQEIPPGEAGHLEREGRPYRFRDGDFVI
jgi:fructokinase